MTFEWSDSKNKLNIEKHGISFDIACHVFNDPSYIEMFDFEHSTDNEDRYIAIGKVEEILFVVFTERKENIRLISARIATKEEEQLYYGQISSY